MTMRDATARAFVDALKEPVAAPHVDWNDVLAAEPYYTDGARTIYHADCAGFGVEPNHFILTDPPYGIGYVSSRGERVLGDAEPFDPTALAQHPAIIFGANHFQPFPPVALGSGLIVWDKRDQVSRGLPGSDAEVAWTNATTQVRIFRHVWLPHTLRDEQRYHPTQKPVVLLERLIQEFTRPDDIIIDPYMGAGGVLKAAKNLGREAIGVEIEERYCEIAARRLSQEVLGL